MRLSHKYKFLFLATPRTASTAVRQVLDGYSDVQSVYKAQITEQFPYYHHISASEMMSIFDANSWNWHEYAKACFVRNPYDRVVSLYHHYLETGSRRADGKSIMYNTLRAVRYKYFALKTFEQFVESININDRLQMPTSLFAADNNGNIAVDEVLKYEELPDCLNDWTQRIGIQQAAAKLVSVNASKEKKTYNQYYTEKSRDIVAKKYASDFNNFGYQI